jgi:hypothetical protein
MADFLTPDEFVAYLWDHYRLRRGGSRLDQLRATGQGPPWALSVLGEPLRHTSEESARRQVAEVRLIRGKR